MRIQVRQAPECHVYRYRVQTGSRRIPQVDSAHGPWTAADSTTAAPSRLLPIGQRRTVDGTSSLKSVSSWVHKPMCIIMLQHSRQHDTGAGAAKSTLAGITWCGRGSTICAEYFALF